MSSSMRIVRVTAAFFLLVGALAATTRADVVFNNFGPGDSFSASGRLLQGESVGTIANVDQAASFTVGSVGALLTGITLGISVEGPPNTGTGPLDVILACRRGRFTGRSAADLAARRQHDRPADRLRLRRRHAPARREYDLLGHRRRQRHLRRRLEFQLHRRRRPHRRPQQQRSLGPCIQTTIVTPSASKGRPAVPEPATLVLVGTALAGMLSCVRRNRVRRSI